MFNRRHFDHRLDMLELYLTVRDPGTAKSADAYDGLRKLLIAANKSTQIHLAHLAELHRIANATESVEPLRGKIGEFMTQMGVVAIADPTRKDLYEFTGGKGDRVVIDSPAYVTTMEGVELGVTRQGIAHWETGGVESVDDEDPEPKITSQSDVENAGPGDQVAETTEEEER